MIIKSNNFSKFLPTDFIIFLQKKLFKMTASETILFIIAAAILILSKANGYELKESEMINGNFSIPHLTPSQRTVYPLYNIPGWSCTHYCEIDNCAKFQAINAALNRIYNDCQGQVIDLNSRAQNQVVTQLITTKAGDYLLSLSYYFPIYNADKKTLLIYFNNQLIFHFKPAVYNQFKEFIFEQKVTSIDGVNNLTLTMTGPTSDGSGFNINNVRFNRIYDPFIEELINNTMTHPIAQTIVSIPAFRVLLGQLGNFFINLDRWQFYIFHRRKQSYYSTIFTYNAFSILNSKGTIIQTQMNSYSHFTAYLNDVFNGFDYKSAYTDQYFLAINRNGNGFIANNSNLFVYSLPIIFLLEILFLIAFKFTFSYPFSKIFRKYSFLAIILLMIFQGNIEQYAFYIFQEFSLFFSTNIMHKLVNIVLLQFFFLTFFMGFGGYIWFVSCHYKKRISYFVESYHLKFKILALLGYSIDNGLIFLLFGATHSLLSNYPILQLFVLIGIQIFWICSRVYYLTHDIYKMKLATWIQIITGFNRIFFQLASIAYHKWPTNFINDNIHLSLIYIFLILWALEVIITIKVAASGICIFLIKSEKIQEKKAITLLQTKSIKPTQVKLHFKPIKTAFFTIQSIRRR